MRLCSYVVVHDTGFAPNPFHGYCTLAACTPNHMNVQLDAGDWILGSSTADTGNRLIYAMKIEEVTDFDAYFRNPAYQSKKPQLHSREWQLMCGDNIYCRNSSGAWEQAATLFHADEDSRAKDLKYHKVYISGIFYYFGENAPLPSECDASYERLVQRRQGCSCKHDEDTVRAFLKWLKTTFRPGVLGLPRDQAASRVEPESGFVSPQAGEVDCPRTRCKARGNGC